MQTGVQTVCDTDPVRSIQGKVSDVAVYTLRLKKTTPNYSKLQREVYLVLKIPEFL